MDWQLDADDTKGGATARKRGRSGGTPAPKPRRGGLLVALQKYAASRAQDPLIQQILPTIDPSKAPRPTGTSASGGAAAGAGPTASSAAAAASGRTATTVTAGSRDQQAEVAPALSIEQQLVLPVVTESELAPNLYALPDAVLARSRPSPSRPPPQPSPPQQAAAGGAPTADAAPSQQQQQQRRRQKHPQQHAVVAASPVAGMPGADAPAESPATGQGVKGRPRRAKAGTRSTPQVQTASAAEASGAGRRRRRESESSARTPLSTPASKRQQSSPAASGTGTLAAKPGRQAEEVQQQQQQQQQPAAALGLRKRQQRRQEPEQEVAGQLLAQQPQRQPRGRRGRAAGKGADSPQAGEVPPAANGGNPAWAAFHLGAGTMQPPPLPDHASMVLLSQLHGMSAGGRSSSRRSSAKAQAQQAQEGRMPGPMHIPMPVLPPLGSHLGLPPVQLHRGQGQTSRQQQQQQIQQQQQLQQALSALDETPRALLLGAAGGADAGSDTLTPLAMMLMDHSSDAAGTAGAAGLGGAAGMEAAAAVAAANGSWAQYFAPRPAGQQYGAAANLGNGGGGQGGAAAAGTGQTPSAALLAALVPGGMPIDEEDAAALEELMQRGDFSIEALLGSLPGTPAGGPGAGPLGPLPGMQSGASMELGQGALFAPSLNGTVGGSGRGPPQLAAAHRLAGRAAGGREEAAASGGWGEADGGRAGALAGEWATSGLPALWNLPGQQPGAGTTNHHHEQQQQQQQQGRQQQGALPETPSRRPKGPGSPSQGLMSPTALVQWLT